jgi:alkanesulfonate monooxygenase SsuD/methylene tetrahydromethanopterin reductase-like flavin-dependent oxidoreductase (luciferase family)
MVVLDIISGGRVSYVFGLGYRPEEYAMFGVAPADRARRTEDNLALVLEALKGEPFDHDGRRIWVTPRPSSDGGPSISYGGGSVAAARRAARFGLDFLAQTDRPELAAAYTEEAARLGRTPGHLMLPSPGDPMTVFVADNVDRAWDELGPYLLHDAVTYAEWNDDADIASVSHAKTVDDLRAERGAHRIFSVDEAVDHVRTNGILPLHPLCGGLPPDVAWPYLRRVAAEVLPAAQ